MPGEDVKIIARYCESVSYHILQPQKPGRPMAELELANSPVSGVLTEIQELAIWPYLNTTRCNLRRQEFKTLKLARVMNKCLNHTC